MQLEPPRRRRNALSLTPLIDVVFILLLFFMLTTRFGQQQAMQMQLPAESAVTGTAASGELLLTLAADGSVSLAGEDSVGPDALARHPAIEAARRNATSVYVVADDEVELQTFIRLMDRLAALGLADIAVRGLR